MMYEWSAYEVLIRRLSNSAGLMLDVSPACRVMSGGREKDERTQYGRRTEDDPPPEPIGSETADGGLSPTFCSGDATRWPPQLDQTPAHRSSARCAVASMMLRTTTARRRETANTFGFIRDFWEVYRICIGCTN